MIAGLSPSAWLLLAAAVGIGLTIELLFFLGHRRRAASRPDLERKA